MRKPITDVIREYRNGQLVEQATEAFADLIQQVQLTRKGGSFTLSLKVTPEAGSANGVEVVADMSVKAPRPTLPKAIFFVDSDFSLSRNDPAQREMFSERIDESTGEVTRVPIMRDVTGGN